MSIIRAVQDKYNSDKDTDETTDSTTRGKEIVANMEGIFFSTMK